LFDDGLVVAKIDDSGIDLAIDDKDDAVAGEQVWIFLHIWHMNHI